MSRARVLVSDELWEQIGGETGLRALPWPNGTVIQGPAREGWPRRKELEISHPDIESDEVVPVFARSDEGVVSFVAWNSGDKA